ncbi:phosphotransferase [Kroppenstedtia sanguinis]|uniref:Phosphotransferase n=1 Tax=Kroppenstedtia sanguinis TaxID=1380684 RepID=A0ABW4C7Q6_9BACL
MKLDPQTDGPVIPRVFAALGWSPVQIRYIRGVLRVDTGDGVFALKKTAAEPAQLTFLHETLSQLKEKGYEHVLLPVKVKEEAPLFVEEEGSCWYVLPWYGEAAEKGDEVPLEELVKGLAQLHKLSEPLLADKKLPASAVATSGLEGKTEAGDRLRQWREVAWGREYASPFEKAVLSHMDYLEKALHFSVEGWRKQKSTGEALPRTTLVHGRLHPHNLLVGTSGWRWIDFDHAHVGSPVSDLAMFLRRFVPFDRDEVVDPFALLKEYEAEYPLKAKEKKLLALHLAYPEGPIRTISSYYARPDRWEEAVAVRTLSEEMDRLRLFRDWVQSVWNTNKRQPQSQKQRQTASVRSSRRKNR